MARRVDGGLRQDYRGDCGRLSQPTLLLTGDPALDMLGTYCLNRADIPAAATPAQVDRARAWARPHAERLKKRDAREPC